ncbi:MobA/MobL family protein, partial [Paenibacillus taihuensis]
MAIYHLSAQVISRSAGRSAVAAAAYRAGEKLQDERLGQVHDFTRKQVADQFIMAPEHAPEWANDRQRLWNEVELAEKRKDAQLCREINVALPRELNDEQQLQLLKEYCQQQFVDCGMVADLSIHRNDPQNPHAHIMLTTRHVTADGFGQKNREWNNKELLHSWREQWAKHANRELERNGIHERIDHRSFQEQGIADRVPTIHEGPTVREMEKRGIATDRGELNRLAKEHNAIVVELQKYREMKEAKQERIEQPPAARKVIAAAEKVIGSTATIENINETHTKLKAEEEQLKIREMRNKERLEPFEMATGHFRSIDAWKQSLEGSSALKRAFDKQERDSFRSTEQLVKKAEEKLQALGFTSKEHFETRRLKVTQFAAQETAAIGEARKRINAERSVLDSAANVLKRV